MMALFQIPRYSFVFVNREFCKKATMLLTKKTTRPFLPETQLEISLLPDISSSRLLKQELSAEEWEFLESLTGLHSISLNRRQLCRVDPKRLWNLPCVQNAKEIYLGFGSNYPNNKLIDLEIDDPFLQDLIDRKVDKFETNTISHVTFDFLLEYIKNWENDCHALSSLVLYKHTISPTFKADLVLLGFSVEILNDPYVTGPGFKGRLVRSRERKEGDQTLDIMIVQVIYPCMVEIQLVAPELKRDPIWDT